MSFPRYPKYKDSGVEWLGQVPAHWEVCALKRIVRIQSGESITAEGIQESGEYPVFGGNGLRGYTSTFTHDGHFVLVGRQGALCGNINYGCGKFWASEHAVVASPVKQVETVWLGEMMRAMNLNQYSVSAAQPGLSVDLVSRLATVLPPLPEQTTIAAFLDRETAKIDALKAEQQRLIELLKGKRQAVISHSVTKGLNPHAPMKPSGIEWLGDVPAHWRVGAIKYFVLPKNGAIKTGPFGSHLTSSDMQSGTVKVYNQRSVIDGDFDSGDNFISEEKFAELATFETFPGDLLITTRGTIGRAAILPQNAERGILHPCLLRLQPDNAHIETEFLKTLIQDSDLMKTQLSYLSNATTIEVIYSYTIASVIIPVPPVAEQHAIMEYLAHQTAKFDTLTAEAQRAIDLLQERRTALISAVVTGQIDVRST